MHPTADTQVVKILNLAGRRVIGGVRLLLRYRVLLLGRAAAEGGRAALMEAERAVRHGLTSVVAGSEVHGAG